VEIGREDKKKEKGKVFGAEGKREKYTENLREMFFLFLL